MSSNDDNQYDQQKAPTERDLPKLRTFVVRQYRGLDDKGAPQSFDISVGAHSVEPDNGDLFFTSLRIQDGRVAASITRAFARGTWSEFEEFIPSGLIS